jgi:hypothetical protein
LNVQPKQAPWGTPPVLQDRLDPATRLLQIARSQPTVVALKGSGTQPGCQRASGAEYHVCRILNRRPEYVNSYLCIFKYIV